MVTSSALTAVQASSGNIHQVYNLPTANLQVKATAKVMIIKDASSQNIIEARLIEAGFEITPVIVADDSARFAMSFTPSVFSNDDIQLTVTADGLLDGVNLTAEDRIIDVITQVTDAPKGILGGTSSAGGAAALAATTVTVEMKDFAETFIIFANEIRSGSASRPWIIGIDGTAQNAVTVDASFDLVFSGATAVAAPAGATAVVHKGLVSRPLKNIKITLTSTLFPHPVPGVPVSTPQKISTDYWVTIPDEGNIVTVPIKRSPGVKKNYTLKFTNGLQTSLTISKPSEFEALVGVPVKIAKALISIPAQLLSFKLENIRRQTTLETDRQALAKAILQTRKNEITDPVELAKARADADKAAIANKTDIVKAELDAQKGLIDAQKALVDSQKSLATSNEELKNNQAKWDTAKNELEQILKKIEAARLP